MSGKRRLALFSTAVWVFLIAAVASSDYRFNWGFFITAGLFLPFLAWGGKWVLDGFQISLVGKMTQLWSKAKKPGYSAYSAGYSPWRRFFAANLDVLMVGYPSVFLVFAMFPKLEPIMAIPIMIVSCICLESFFLMCWGTTLGKATLGLSVERIGGSKFEFWHGIRRGLKKWSYGYGFGIPLVSLVTLSLSYIKFCKTASTAWDESGEYRVIAKPFGWLKFTTVMFGVLVAFTFAKVIKDEVERSKPVAKATWLNPITLKSVTLPVGIRSVADANENPLLKGQFAAGDRMYVRLIHEKIEKDGLPENIVEIYATELKKNIDGSKRSVANTEAVENFDFAGTKVYTFLGPSTNPKFRLTYFVWSNNKKDFWYVQATTDVQDDAARVEAFNTFQSLLAGT